MKNIKILDIRVRMLEKFDKTVKIPYPKVRITASTPTETATKEMLDEGWLSCGYDYYMGIYNYDKLIDIKDIIKLEIVYADNIVQCDVPDEVAEEVGRFIHANPAQSIPKETKKKIISIINQEY